MGAVMDTGGTGGASPIPGMTMAQIQQAAAAAGMSVNEYIAKVKSLAGSGTSTQSMVLMEPQQTKYGSTNYSPATGRTQKVTKSQPVMLPDTAAAAAFLTWTPAQQQAAIDRMNAAGLNVTSVEDAYAKWKTLVGYAADTYLAAQAGVPGAVAKTPWQMLGIVTGGGAGGVGGSSTTSSSTTTNYSPTDMQNTAQPIYQSELGRDPTPAEVAQAPSSTTSSSSTTTKSSRSGSSSSTTTNSGVNIPQSITNQARQNNDWAEYQSATKYMDALVSALRAQV